MKQVFIRHGKIQVSDVPAPALPANNILVEVSKSLISTGTEVATLNQSGQNLASKVVNKPAEALKVIQSLKVRGVSKTWALIENKLDELIPMGYSCSGRVLAVGEQIQNLMVNDRVACAGAGLANHAEVVSVPKNLTVKIPEGVTDSQAAFVTLGSIALQGVRRADVRLGEKGCVMGLGLLGQLTVQLLRAAGCDVVGLDLDQKRVDLAGSMGLTMGATSWAALQKIVNEKTHGHGVDATIITASTADSELANQSFAITRKKGKIVVVGAVGMNLNRSPFYEKEQDFLISCSYGPGRYDAQYEFNGNDYPYSFVRWTENRNMAAFLQLVAEKKINVDVLIDKSFPIKNAELAYEELKSAEKKPLAVVLDYDLAPSHDAEKRSAVHLKEAPPPLPGRVKLGVVGVGEFTKAVHLPNLSSLSEKVSISAICAATPTSAANIAAHYKVPMTSTNALDIFHHSGIDAVLISTRHHQHAAMAINALKAGKHVYLEKPLALTETEVNEVASACETVDRLPVLFVGFNRRFSASAIKLKSEVQSRTTPMMLTYRVNAGSLPPQHWVYTDQGGGRLRGEACHMIDFFQFLVEKPLIEMAILPIQGSGSTAVRPDDNFSAQFKYEDGSVCTLIYTSQGHSSVSKEWIEVHWNGNSAVIDDFKSLSINGKFIGRPMSIQDKGHLNALRVFFNCIQNAQASPFTLDMLKETTIATIKLDQQVWGKI